MSRILAVVLTGRRYRTGKVSVPPAPHHLQCARAKIVGLQFVAGLALDLVEQVDGIDAVDSRFQNGADPGSDGDSGRADSEYPTRKTLGCLLTGKKRRGAKRGKT